MSHNHHKADCSECNHSIELGKRQQNGLYYFNIDAKKNRLKFIDDHYLAISITACIGFILLYLRHGNSLVIFLLFFLALLTFVLGLISSKLPLFEIYIMDTHSVSLIKIKKNRKIIIPEFKATFVESKSEESRVLTVPKHNVRNVLNIQHLESMISDAKNFLEVGDTNDHHA